MDEPSPGSRKWPASRWRDLLRDAIRLLDSLADPPAWTFGGGTALAVHLNHRVSYDVDAFVADADVVRDLTPARNPLTRQLLDGRKYEYPGNYLKLDMGGGEIDFIVGGRRTDTPSIPWDFEGRIIRIETPWETAIKKIFYRPSTFKVRDLFDLAAVLDRHHDAVRQALPEVEDRLDKLVDRIQRLAPVYAVRVAEDINPTEDGRRYMTAEAPDRVLAFLAAWRKDRPAGAG
ncbi:nucleotidyl transferase AbiEii/AbiGii toxin family protein [Azospirillum sp. ST 5-10]|uniref:nucleotidyl transferase AbiEii/AbiGii toxin family protein n=1 Tax=unclassified Azospirillum TaxID=2630922 RepID=UPI003F49DE98